MLDEETPLIACALRRSATAEWQPPPELPEPAGPAEIPADEPEQPGTEPEELPATPTEVPGEPPPETR